MELVVAVAVFNVFVSLVNAVLNKGARVAWLCSALGWAMFILEKVA